MDADELRLLSETMTHLLDRPAGEVGDELLQAGLGELLGDDLESAVRVLFEAQGRLPAASPALPLLVRFTWGETLDLDGDVLFPLPGVGPTPGSIREGRLHVDGVSVHPGPVLDYRVAATGPDGVVIAVVPADAVTRTPIGGFDETLGLHRVRAEVATGSVAVLGTGEAWTAGCAVGRRALGHELVGGAERMLELAVEHAVGREQFGKPIASFQTVKHRLADVAIAVTAARRALDVSWEVGDELSAMVAKVLAAEAALLATKHAQQVTGGIGFTWEFGLHRYVRRAGVLDALLGARHELVVEIGRRLLQSGEVPRLAVL
jgi:hypothetical protein